MPAGVRRLTVTRGPGRLLVLVALAAVAIVPAAPLVAPAAEAAAVPQLESQLTALYHRTDQLVERWNQGQLQLAATRRAIIHAVAAIRAGRSSVARLRAAIGEQAAAEYMTGPASNLTVLLGSQSPADAIERIEVLQLLAQDSGLTLDRLGASQQALVAELTGLRTAERAEAAQLRQLAAARASIQAAIGRAQALVNQLRAAAAVVAPQHPVLARQITRLVSPPKPQPPAAPAIQSLSGARAIAVRFAYAQVGKPYIWGGSGPVGFDCSGLTMAAWAAAGVSLPHSATLQYYVGVHVSAAELQPGDLIFSYGLGHVAMYVGHGMQIEATHTGSYVLLDPVGQEPIVGFTNPIG